MNARDSLALAFRFIALTALVTVVAGTIEARPVSAERMSAQAHNCLATIDSLWETTGRDSTHKLTNEAFDRARNAGDSTLCLELLIRKGRQARFFGRVIEGEQVLRDAVALAAVLGDSSRMTPAVRWLSVVVGLQGRREEALMLYQRLLHLATSQGDRANEGWAHVGFAWDDLSQGRTDAAIQRYQRALHLFEAENENEGILWCLFGLVHAMSTQGDLNGAIALLERARELALRISDEMSEAIACNDLGLIEYMVGDPGRALQLFLRAGEIHARMGSMRETVLPACNVALCLSALWRFEEADSILSATLELTRTQGYRDLEIVVEKFLAQLNEHRERPSAAAQGYRAILSKEQFLKPRNAIEIRLGLARALARMDSAQAALDTLAAALNLMSAGVGRIHAAEVLYARAMILDSLGVPSVDAYRSAATEALAAGEDRMAIAGLTGLGRCFHTAGYPDSARLCLLHAAEIWEGFRQAPSDPRWREERGMVGTHLYSLLGRVLADGPGGLAEAFGRLQAFKSRSLLEQIHGPSVVPQSDRENLTLALSLPTLEQIQKSVLRPGELLLDYYLGADSTLLFAVTCDEARMVTLPGAALLASKLSGWRDLVAAPPHCATRGEEQPARDAELKVVQNIGEHTAQILFAGVEDLVRKSDSIVISPDGPLHLAPYEALCAELNRMVCERIPSVSVLVSLRKRNAPDRQGPDELLALVGHGRDKPLHGAKREARNLARAFRHARVASRFSADSLSERLKGPDILHLASHFRIDQENPWQSEIELFPAGSPQNPRAGEIARLDLDARLVVLSSCSSAGGQVLSGEGVLGVTGAFLSAGVPCVVATLWPVDDRVTADLMRTFYQHLAAGTPVAVALRKAQTVIRNCPDTRHPFFWAGFVVIGDGQQTFRLEARGQPHVFILAVIVLLIGFWAAWVRSRTT